MTTAFVPAWQAAFRSDPGRVRTNNEDLPLVDAERGVYGVIDGVGGQAAGELAAAIARDVILQRLARPLGTPAERVREAIAIANNEIFRRAASSPELAGMTCVVTLALVTEGRLTIGHVGDSRLYKLRGHGIQKLTHDHSPVGEREDARELSELDAMRHPRRNEVFRDVGGALRDKDEDEYVEVIEAPLENDAALLLCTDGLTDMIASATIDRIVRKHAGDPDAVAAALVEAANEAGGRDNVTVVYAEGPGFARAAQRARSDGLPFAGGAAGPDFPAPILPAADLPPTEPERGAVHVLRWILRSRITWFAAGAAAGVVAALLLVWRAGQAPVSSPRVLAVSADASAAFSSLADALRTSRPGDVLQLEPGTYTEAVVLPDGVALVARVPGTVTFERPAASADEWIAITAGGEIGSRVSGIRIASTPEQPIDVGIRLSGQGHALDLVELSGPMRAGIELGADASATLNGGYFALDGIALEAGDRSDLSAIGNLFIRPGHALVPPLVAGDDARASMKKNVFAGYGNDVVRGLPDADKQQILASNVIVNVTAEPALPR
jgi:serine/threonine protein phosphatase PrpC